MSSLTSHDPAVEAGIDWVSCSAARPALSAALLRLGGDLVEQEWGSGGIIRPYYNHGFAGFKAGAAAYGFGTLGTIVSVSGATARESAAELFDCAENVSRLDVQVTVRSGDCGGDYVKGVYRRLASLPRGRGRPVAHTLITSDWTGDTLNIGKRTSDHFGRIYNKSAEEKVNEVPLRWRWEVEYKGKPAWAAASSFAASSDKDSWVVGEVFDWFERRHCAPPISKVSRVDLCRSSRGSSSQANQLRWLKVGVRPVLMKLAAVYGWPDILAQLGVPMRYSETYVNEVLGPSSEHDRAYGG